MIVVDTNIIGYLYLASEQSALAEQALLKAPEWAAPLLWRSELRNVLALYMRRDLLSVDDARRIMDEAESLMQGREFEVASLQVLGLVAASTCSAYDCEFVALAETLGVSLLTVDQQILKQFPTLAVSLDVFVSL